MARRTPRKQPGEMEAAKVRHVARQKIQDAITFAKTNPGIPVELELHGGRWELVGLVEADRLAPFFPGKYLVQVSGNRLQIGWVVDKDGVWLEMPTGSPFHFRAEDHLIGTVRPLDEAAEAYC